MLLNAQRQRRIKWVLQYVIIKIIVVVVAVIICLTMFAVEYIFNDCLNIFSDWCLLTTIMAYSLFERNFLTRLIKYTSAVKTCWLLIIIDMLCLILTTAKFHIDRDSFWLCHRQSIQTHQTSVGRRYFPNTFIQFILKKFFEWCPPLNYPWTYYGNGKL